jgi:hypothetical protein
MILAWAGLLGLAASTAAATVRLTKERVAQLGETEAIKH